MKLERMQAVVRDLGCTLVGLGGIVHQELTGAVNPWLLGVYTTILGVPGAAGLWRLRVQIPDGSSGDGQRSGSPRLASPPGVPPSSPNAPAGGGEP